MYVVLDGFSILIVKVFVPTARLTKSYVFNVGYSLILANKE